MKIIDILIKKNSKLPNAFLNCKLSHKGVGWCVGCGVSLNLLDEGILRFYR